MPILTSEREIPRHKARETTRPSPWVIVLAGGKGERMRPTVLRWLNENRPKQYCAFVGTRSMLQHTLDRASALATPDRIVAVIGQGHESFYIQAVNPGLGEVILRQPADRGTATAILHALAYITEQDPSADVVILPSDHYVHPEAAFIEHLRRACWAIEADAERLTLLGATPTRPETDYGWIVPDTKGTAERNKEVPWPVRTFQEKPDPIRANELFHQGSLWNTMIVASSARLLWTLGERHLPEATEAFTMYRRVLRAVRHGEVDRDHAALALAHVYSRLRPADFSREILERATGSSAVLPLIGLDWSDWGRPERVVECLSRIGVRPAFLGANEDGAGVPTCLRHGVPRKFSTNGRIMAPSMTF